MASRGPNVAIVGGGIGGVAAALALTRAGVDTQLYEQAPELGEVGAGVKLTPNSIRVLERLGLGSGLREYGAVAPPHGQYCLLDGTIVGNPSPRKSPSYGMHRADLLDILLRALPAGVVNTGHRCVGFEPGDGQSTVVFDNGRSIQADVVIGADGIHSVLQGYVTPRVPPVPSGYVVYRGLIANDAKSTWDPFLNRIWMGPGRHFLVFPVRVGQLLSYVGFVPTDEEMRESWSAPGDPQQLAREFAGWDPLIGSIIDSVQTTNRWGIYDREPFATWTSGRLTLLGDAAHPMQPHLAQGANQAIEDAAALAASLAGRTTDDALAGLAMYEDVRRERTTRVQRISRRYGTSYDTNGERIDTLLEEFPTRDEFFDWLYEYDVEAAVAALRS